MSQTPDQYSFLEKAIDILSNGHDVESDKKFGVSHERGDYGKCKGLATGEESYFTAIVSNVILGDLNARLVAGKKKPVEFHTFIDNPSRRTEKHLGSDLSLGQYDSLFRIRVMHDMLHRHWCDQAWDHEYRFNAKQKEDKTGDYGHLRTLLRTYKDHPNIHPYLVINVTFCVHDYRRFGCKDARVPFLIPGLMSMLRTVVIDLAEITLIPKWDAIVDDERFVLRIVKRACTWDDSRFTASSDPFVAVSGKDAFSITIAHGRKELVSPFPLKLGRCLLPLEELLKRVETLHHDNETLLALANAKGLSVHEFSETFKEDVMNRDWGKLGGL